MDTISIAPSAVGVQTQQKRYELHWAGDPAKPPPLMDWIVKGLFSAGSVNLLVGEAKSLKSYSMLHLAVCMSRGTPWLNHPTTRGVALVIDGESKKDEIERRLNAISRGLEVRVPVQVAYTSLARFNLLKEDDSWELFDAIMTTCARLVIIDALADVMLGGDENNVKDVQVVFARLRQLADYTKAAIVVIHHRLLNVEWNRRKSLIFTSDKFRDGDNISIAAYPRFSDGVFELLPAPHQGLAIHLSKQERQVLLYLRDHGASPVRELQDNINGVVPDLARSVLYRLRDKGLLHRVDAGDRGRSATYGLAPQGQETTNEL